jgi:Carboxypeptidase regulatory-like domain
MATPFQHLRHMMAMTAALFGVWQSSPVRAETGPDAGWTANDDDAVLFDARLGQWRLGDGVRGYQTPQGICLDLADTIMALDLPIRLDKKLRRATGWAFEERNAILIDREAKIVQIMNKNEKLSPSDIYDTPEGWCVNAQAMARWLGIKLEADSSNALLIIKASTKLPVELAAERRSRAAKIRPITNFDLKSLPQADMPFRGVKAPSVEAVVTLGGVREGKGKIRPDVQYEFYASGEIGPVAYDARLASDRKAVPESLRVRAYRVDPTGHLFGDGLPVTQVAAGDVTGFSTALVSQANIGRGAMVTNRPIDRPDSYDRTDFRGELPAGWDAELYRNGQLLALSVDRSDGRYEFLAIPLLYGQNKFEVVLYGPQGQIRRDERTVTVGFDSIPPRQTWYWAGINQDGRDLIGLGRIRFGTGAWRGSVGVERGIDARTSAQIAFHSLYVREVGRRNFLEGSVRRAVGPALFEFSSATDFKGGAAFRSNILAEFGGTYVTGESIFATGGFRSDRVLENVTGRHSLALDRTVSLGRSVVPLHFDARYTTRSTGQASFDLVARASTNVGRLTLTNETSWRHDRNPFGRDPPGTIESSFLGNARLGRVRFRGETRFRLAPQRHFQSATLVGEWTGKGDMYEAPDFRAEIGYERERDRARFGLGYVRRFEKFALTANAEAATDGSVALGLNLSFSLGPNPTHPGRIRLTSSHLASQGQILARVYRDVNGDGKRQDDEPVESDVQLATGRTPVRDLTDKHGAVIISDVQPYVPILVGIDAGSLPDPLIQPATAGIVVTPRPGVTAIIDLPLVGAGEVDGTLIRSGGNGIEGVDLDLIDTSLNVVARTRTDFDGYFIFESVPYGKYSIRISKTSADIAQLRQALSGTFQISGETPSAHLGIVAADPTAGQMAAGP